MTRYRDMDSRELAEWALYAFRTDHPPANRLVYALAKRLEQEHIRANRLEDRDKAHRSTMGKPHLAIIRTRGIWWNDPPGPHMWRCIGPGGVVQYGDTPARAYRNWQRAMRRDARNLYL